MRAKPGEGPFKPPTTPPRHPDRRGFFITCTGALHIPEAIGTTQLFCFILITLNEL